MWAKNSTLTTSVSANAPADRADGAAAAAEEADPAEHDRGDRREDEDVAAGRVAGVVVATKNSPAAAANTPLNT